MSLFEGKFWKNTAERAMKTGVQSYLLAWGIFSGIGGETPVVTSESYDLLFTLDNVKAAVAGVFLSVATSILGKNFGTDKEDPSVV